MKLFKNMYAIYELIIARYDEAMYICLKNDLPLTSENISNIVCLLRNQRKSTITKELIQKANQIN